MRYILASASPRRAEILKQIGLEFEVIISDCDENTDVCEPGEYVEKLAKLKASAVADKIIPAKDMVIIAADTVVSIGDRILGKPSDEADAYNMLKTLSGNEHEVYTGISLIYKEEGSAVQRCWHESSRVRFYELADEDILSYIKSGEPMDKAGAYGIQGIFARYISSVEGEYTNIVGLPAGSLFNRLKKYGLYQV